MSNSYYGGYDSGSGGGIIIFFVVLIVIGVIVALSNKSGSSSSSDYNYDNYSQYDYDVPSYVDDRPEPDYDYYDYFYEEPYIETWDCVDTTSYDKNPYNDNYCVSSYGREMYATDSYAESLDPSYTAGTAGHPYYNSF